MSTGIKALTLYIVGFIAFFITAILAQASQQQRPQANVDDLFNRIGRCQVESELKEKYIIQLEAKIVELNAKLKVETGEGKD